MISKTVTQTQRFLRLPLEAQALYFHLIQNADDDGVVEAFPVVRMINANEDSLSLLIAKCFIKPLNDEMVYFIIDFHEQNKVRADRKVNSIYIDLLKEIIPELELIEPRQRVDRPKNSINNLGQPMDNHGTDMGQQNISKYKLSKDNTSSSTTVVEKNKITENPTPTPPTFSQEYKLLYAAFEKETGQALTPFQREELQNMLNDYNYDLIHEALRESVLNSKANFSYIKAILSRWKSDNLLTVELVRNAKQKRKNFRQQANNEIDPTLGF